MRGYVVENEKGEFLARLLYWFPHEKPDIAWVHPSGILTDGKFTIDTERWESKPKYAYHAEYMGEKTIIGERFEIE